MTTTLTRTLKLPSLVLFGLAYLTPIIVLGIFGIIAETGGAAPAAYLVALVAMLFTAHSYGRMAIAYPVAGSAYTYVRRSIDPRVGFLVGWAVLLDYLFLPMVIWLIGGSYLSAQFPNIPIGVWIVGFIVITTLLNILGIKVADKANYVLMAFQLLVLVFFVALAIGNVVSANGAGGLASGQPFFNDTASFTTISAGAAIAAYSFLGFDAVTTLTEETINPRRTVPRAITLVALIGGGIFVAVSYVTQLVHPGVVFEDSASAASAIALQIGGQLFGAVFLAGLVVAQFASGLAAQASASRLLYAMGRDSVLPKAVFGKLNPKFHPRGQPGDHRRHRALPGRGHVGVVHQLRYLHRLHAGERLGGVPLCAPAPGRAAAEPGVLRGGPGDQCHHLRLPALPAGQLRHYAGGVLAGAGHRGAGPDHPGLQGGAAGDDRHGEGDGRGGRLSLPCL